MRADELVSCAGDPRAMGEQQGAQARRESLAVVRAFLAGPELEAARPRLVPRRLFQALARRRARAALAGPLARLAPEQHARLQGIALGSGLPLDLLYLGLAGELLLNDLDWVPGACSALAVRGARSADGAARIAKNFDYPDAFRVGFVVRRSAPRDGLRSLEVTVAPLAGCHSGLNEAGLALTYNYGHAQEESGPHLPVTLLAQRLLERCRSVAEAEALVRATPRAGSAILVLADAGGDLAVLELTPSRTSARRPAADVLCATNHYQAPDLLALDVPSHALHGPGAVPAVRGRRVRASSEARLAAFERFLAARPGALSPRDLEACLRDHGAEGRGDDGTLCRHGPYNETTCAVVLSPRERALRVLFGRPCEQRFAEHRLDPLPAPRRRALPVASSS